LGNGISKAGAGVGQGASFGKNMVAQPSRHLGKTSASNLYGASKVCPIAFECRNAAEGILLGDFKKVALNGGLLALYAAAVGGASNAQAKQTLNMTSKGGLLVTQLGACCPSNSGATPGNQEA